MSNITNGLPVSAQPWAREVETRLDQLQRVTDLNAGVLGEGTVPDRTVYSEFENGQQIANGIDGYIPPTADTQVRYVSGSGLFEVTVSLAGLVQDGATLAASFVGDAFPYLVEFGLPKDAVVFTAPLDGREVWHPFAASYSKIVSARPGIYDLQLYFHAVTTASAMSLAYVRRASLSIKAV